MARTIEIGTFGVTSIVFFRRNVRTNEPILRDPIVWTFDVAAADKARDELIRLKKMTHLFVLENALTVSYHGK